MLDPKGLYEFTAKREDLGRPVLLHALNGFVDAGNAGRLAREHLMESLGSTMIARFDIDQLFDYRSRRPIMQFSADHGEGR